MAATPPTPDPCALAITNSIPLTPGPTSASEIRSPSPFGTVYSLLPTPHGCGPSPGVGPQYSTRFGHAYTTTRSPSVANFFRSFEVNSSHGTREKLCRSFRPQKLCRALVQSPEDLRAFRSSWGPFPEIGQSFRGA
ncbi:hypothetical protein CROQUDRAFT_650602 [Cronartium quercuum f. sp. fusiforme G11]|uniref:Uncharacterized protein n=1 Tax=Cronartium quercuum f. sp. fusiforme G11 TaxID=708437 RepID=A0A9P6NRG2_9BASI|nr:hypothetical protein CROQUDRAFT_650602 [Cronartium quercuum f. sp. fusiforme G11]